MNIFKKFFGNRYESGESANAVPGSRRTAPADHPLELDPVSWRQIIANARTLFANSGFVRDIVAANDIYSVGDGITPEPVTGDEAWNLAAEQYFCDWSQNVSVGGGMTLGEATSLASQRLDIDGEIYAIKTRDGAGPRLRFMEAQHIAADRSGDGVVQGIRFDRDGKPEEYFFRVEGDEAVGVPAAAVLHCFVRETFSSVHGVPQIQHAIRSISDTREILRAVTANAKVQHAIAMVMQSERAATYGNGELFGDLAGSSPDYLGKIANTIDGEDLKAFQTTSPNESILNALNILDRRSCGGVLPPDFFDPTKIGGASTRLVVSKAARHFGRRQTVLINHFLRPVWAYVIADAMESGALAWNEDFMRVEWNCPKAITVDAGREEATDLKLVEAGLKSESSYYAERGVKARAEMRRAVADRAARLAEERAHGITGNAEGENA